MNIAFVGCGFVFDIYMRTILAHPELKVFGVYDLKRERSLKVGEYYGFHVFNDYEELLSNEDIDTVVNLTNISSHFEVSKRALDAGKHVYSEKPLTKSVDESLFLFELAKAKNLLLFSAPSNVYSDTVRTMFKAVEDGAIGKPLLIYAELDDNPIHLMEFEKVKSPTGAPWPLEEEIREGCTYEHVGYHLVWICALLGPVISVTAFSKELIENKMAGLPSKVGTPDYSVGCLEFANGSTARITCSVVAPRDHRMRIIGDEGEVYADSYRHYQSPVFLERFSKSSLNARKFKTLRLHSMLGRLFGIGGQRLKLVRNWKSVAVENNHQIRGTFKQRLLEWLRRKEVYAQDKLIGIAEMANTLKKGEAPFLSPEFLIHINELTLLIQNAGPKGIAVKPSTSFEPLGSIPNSLNIDKNFRTNYTNGFLESLLSR